MSQRKWPITAAIDRQLRRIYQGEPKPMTLTEYAQQIGYPCSALSGRAAQLGLNRGRERNRWSPEETLIIIRNIRHTVPYIHRQLVVSGFDRSYEGVKSHIKRAQLRRYGQYLTVAQVAAGFGVDVHTVQAWIDPGLLKALNIDKRRFKQQDLDWSSSSAYDPA